jgi:hypothetical protein
MHGAIAATEHVQQIILTETDRPWTAYKVKLALKKRYTLKLIAKDDNIDPFLILRNADRNPAWERHDDDSGGYPDSSLYVEYPPEGEYWIIATTAPRSIPGRNSPTGKLELRIQEAKD